MLTDLKHFNVHVSTQKRTVAPVKGILPIVTRIKTDFGNRTGVTSELAFGE